MFLGVVDSGGTACISIGWLVVAVLILACVYLALRILGRR